MMGVILELHQPHRLGVIDMIQVKQAIAREHEMDRSKRSLCTGLLMG